jgi:hypothetical protein
VVFQKNIAMLQIFLVWALLHRGCWSHRITILRGFCQADVPASMYT